MSLARPLWLASRSPRRRALLDEAGVEVHIEPADIDDGLLRPGDVQPSTWVVALAYLKARRVADRLRARGYHEGTVLGADTVCVLNDVVVGQPRDRAHAESIIRGFMMERHHTLSGVCLLDLADGGRSWLADSAEVELGVIDEAELDRYLVSDEWQGKAGGYNLQERIDGGWPLRCTGDPATVMGLPMQRLKHILRGDHTS